MEIKYFLPQIKELHIYNYDLYKCPVDIVFSSKLNLVFGTNGLGKTTLLNIMQYSIIGPYTGKLSFRNWKDQQKLKRPRYNKDYFRKRMKNINKEARVTVIYELNEDIFEVTHSLYEDKLIALSVNGEIIIGDDMNYEQYEKKYFGQNDENLNSYLIDKYHRHIEKSSKFPDINSYILMITEMMFFTESRKFVFWDENLGKLVMSKFVSEKKYFEYDEVQKAVKKYDSQARLMSYKMSMVKEFLGEDIEGKEKDIEYSIDDLNKIDAELNNQQHNIEGIEKNINDNSKEKTKNRIEYEAISRKLLDVEEKWYKNIFPDPYQDMFNRYIPSITEGKCPFCGSEHMNKKVQVEKCFFCENKIVTKKTENLSQLEIERKNLELEKNRLDSNYKILKSEGLELKQKLFNEQKELQVLIEKQQEIKRSLDVTKNDNYAKYQQLEVEKQKYTNLLIQAKEQESILAKQIDEYMQTVFSEYNKIFKKYAYSFLGNDKKVELELIGDTENELFRFYLNGTAREDAEELSESQRIFVDMAYRLSVLEFMHESAYFISETPDSTLDYVFEENAVKTFSYFIESGNTLFMSANARNSKLINMLAKRYKGEFELINLLEISNLAGNQLQDVEELKIYNFLEE